MPYQTPYPTPDDQEVSEVGSAHLMSRRVALLHRGRIPVLAIATMLVIGASYVRWSPHAGQRSAVVAPNDAALTQSARTDRAEVSRLIGEFERQVSEQPNATGLTFLAQLYLRRGRLSGDVASYAQAHAAIDQSLAMRPDDTETRGLLASVLATTHDFVAAADVANAVLADAPSDLNALAVLGDAQLEIGAYDSARQTYDNLAKQSPDGAAALVRQARLAFLTGRVEDAVGFADRAKQQATASAFGDAGLAFYSTFQAQLEHDAGHYDKAASLYQKALRESPGYYIALAGLGRERAAQGRTDDAVRAYEQAVATVPQPETLAALGDLYQLRHDPVRAQAQYDAVGVIATLADLNKQVYNRALAAYEADHDILVDDALRLATAELAIRHDIYGYDIYAWALYKNQRYAEARQAAVEALTLGTPDARLLYHAGMIDAALGSHAAAIDELSRALKLSPHFDPIQARFARSALADETTRVHP